MFALRLYARRHVLLAACLLAAVLLPACDISPGPVPSSPSSSSSPAATARPHPSGLDAVNDYVSGVVQGRSAARQSQANADILAQIDGYLAGEVQRDEFSGAVLLARDGKIVLSKGYGLADREQDVVNATYTKFRIGPLTKGFTALAIMILQEQGRLSTADLICKYLPNCPPAWSAVAILQLLNYTSGLPAFTDFLRDAKPARLPPPIDQLTAYYKDKPLVPLFTQPANLPASYNSLDYELLGYIIEKVSGQTYEQFLQKNIFDPLGMKDTGYAHNRYVLQHRAGGYFSPQERARYIDIDSAYASGALYSTVEDLYKWDQALYTIQLVSQRSLDEMFAPSGLDYGYGWTVTRRPWGKVVEESGFIEGFQAYIGRFVDSRVTVILLSNLEVSQMDAIRSKVSMLVFSMK